MNPFNEDQLIEQTVITLLKEMWHAPSGEGRDVPIHINAYADADDLALGREHRGEVVLKKYLLPALETINPHIPRESLLQAMDALTRDRSNLSLARANQEIYKLLRDGANVQVVHDGGEVSDERVHFFDFEHADRNHFLIVSQLWVAGEQYTRRPDVVLFVNGIPLVLFELKASHKSLVDAHRDNIRDYKDTIPKLFWYNMGIVLSNGIENTFGSMTAPFEFFNEWKKAEYEEDAPKTDLATMLHGLCDQTRLLDIFENYILFEEARGELRKIVPRYFQ